MDERLAYVPKGPSLLENPSCVQWIKREEGLKTQKKICSLFPLTANQPFLIAQKGEKQESKPLKIGAVFSGGQASGGHNVIIGIYRTLHKLHAQSKLFGFLGGPSGI